MGNVGASSVDTESSLNKKQKGNNIWDIIIHYSLITLVNMVAVRENVNTKSNAGNKKHNEQ